MRGLATLLVAGVIAVASPAAAGPRLGTIDAPADLEAALRIALEPWGIEVVVLPGPAPAGAASAARAAAAERAAADRVTALLWVDGPGIYLYEVDSDELSVRPLPAVLDESSAAAIALTAKTMLRTTVVAPPPERFGATAPPAPSRLRILSAIGVRRSAGIEARLGVGLAWWPAALGGRAGIAVSVVSGPGLPVDDPRLLARFTDATAAVSARGRLPLTRRLGLDGGLGVSAHATSVDGFSPEHRIAVSVSRVNPALDADLALAVAIGPRSELALDAAAGLALRRQRYLIGGAPVLELPLVELRVGLELRVHLP